MACRRPSQHTAILLVANAVDRPVYEPVTMVWIACSGAQYEPHTEAVVSAALTRAIHGPFRRRLNADEVVNGLWIGSAPSSLDVAALVSSGIDAVVDLRAEDDVRRDWPDDIEVRIVALRDHGTPSVDELHAAATAVSDLMGNGRTVFVHCHAGVERAPTVACAALVLQGWSLEDAYRRVIERRGSAAPTDGQLATVRTLASQRSAALAR